MDTIVFGESMFFTYPFDADTLRSRDGLLQECLRPKVALYPIAQEYPLVLSESRPQLSICVCRDVKSGREVIGHANLWPRYIFNAAASVNIPIGLVGNVATHHDMRGQGIMRSLFQEIESRAIGYDMAALVLWSDLHRFYQKLGFSSFGSEYRFRFQRDRLSNEVKQMTFDPISGSQLTPSVLQDLLALRYPTPGFLSRSLSEFAELLEIPDTVTLVCRSHEEIIGFCIVGRGYDMIGVVHEWGGASPDIVLAGLRHIAEITEWKSVCLLAPPMLSPDWKASFLEVADSGEQYPMALAKFLRADLVGFLDETYIWGLDSI